MSQRLHFSAFLGAVFCAFIWGTSATCSKIALQTIDITTYNIFRFGCALPFLFFVRRPDVPIKTIALLAAFWGFFNNGLTGLAIKFHVPVGPQSLIFHTNVFMAIIIASLWLKERITKRNILCITLAFIGVALLSPHVFDQTGNYFALIFTILGAFCTALSTVWWRKLKVQASFPLVVWVMSFNCLYFLLLEFSINGIRIFTELPKVRTWDNLGLAIFTGLAGSLMADAIWVRLLSFYNVALLIVHKSMAPIFSVALGVFIFNEGISPLKIGAGILILGAVIANQRLNQNHPK